MKIHYLLQCLLLITSFNALAQSGPEVPCVNCAAFTLNTEPFNGMWYNPEQSGTGFGIDVQNGTLFGAYYGYKESGKQIWLTFVGDLQPSDEDGIMWTVDADLTRFKNGNSFNQAYSQPEHADYTGTIHFKFTQKNHAIYRVNDGVEQNIVPIVFGVPATADFPKQTSYKFPELTGDWSFTFSLNFDEPLITAPEPWTYLSATLSIPKKEYMKVGPDGTKSVKYTLNYFYSIPDFITIGEITCSQKLEIEKLVGPSCVFQDRRGLFGSANFRFDYHFSIGGLGAFRLFGESEEGHTFEAIKINSKEYKFDGKE